MTIVKNIALLPVWFVQIFTGHKSFSSNPIIGSRLLNRLGLHVSRVVLAKVITEFRLLFISPLVPADYRRKLRTDGYLVIENFLEPDQFSRLEAELRECNVPVRECKQGDTLTLNSLLDRENLDRLPECRKVVENKIYNRLMMYAGSHLNYPHYYINAIKNGYEEGGEDPQKNYHSDTFHMTAKSWLYIDDVTHDNGPFQYIPGSHRLTLDRLKWEYRQSVRAKLLTDRYAVKGSLRLYEDDEYYRCLPAPKSFDVPRNTLVIANTSGLHCRGSAKKKSSRMGLYASNRANPFNPFPGIPIGIYHDFINHMVKKSYENADKQAENKGVLSSWHIVPSEKLHS